MTSRRIATSILTILLLGALFYVGDSRTMPQSHTTKPTNVSAAAARGAAGPSLAGGYFKNFAMAGVSGIGGVYTFQKEIILLDRTDGDNTHIKLPNGRVRD